MVYTVSSFCFFVFLVFLFSISANKYQEVQKNCHLFGALIWGEDYGECSFVILPHSPVVATNKKDTVWIFVSATFRKRK